MSSQSDPIVSFVVNIASEAVYNLYDIAGKTLGHQIAQRVKLSSLVHRTKPELKVEMKKLLRRSIHKGKFRGFQIGETFIPFEDMVLASIPSNLEIYLVLEYQSLSLGEMIKVIEEKKEKLIRSGGMTDELTSRLTKDFCWSSDAIEGTTVESDESKLFLSDPKDVEGEDKIELLHHFNTVNSLVLPMKDRPITDIDEKYMIALHKGLDILNLTSDRKGVYRTAKVIIRGAPDPMFTSHENLPGACKKMFETLHGMTDKSFAFKASWLHYQFIQHHPFFDGNGRVGRMLMITVLIQGGYPIPCIQPGIRDIYFHSLTMARRWEMTIANGHKLKEGIATPYDFLLRIILEALCRSLDIGIHMVGK